MKYLGDYVEDATIVIPFTTNDASGGTIDPSDDFEVDDFMIVKNGTTIKASVNGLTVVTSFNSITGRHYLIIDTSNDIGDTGYWVKNADYDVTLNPDTETVDGQTVVAIPAVFSIENRFMRGTNNSALAIVCTEARLSELDAGNLPADVDAILAGIVAIVAKLPAGLISDFNEATDGVFMSGAKNVLDDLNDISSADIAAIFAGLLDSGVLVNGITITDDDAIEITRGDKKTITINLGSQWPLTNKKVYFIIKKKQTDDNSTAIVNREVDSIIDEANGIAQIILLSTETTPVDCYHYEVELRDDPSDENPQTPLQGMLKINQDTRQ